MLPWPAVQNKLIQLLLPCLINFWVEIWRECLFGFSHFYSIEIWESKQSSRYNINKTSMVKEICQLFIALWNDSFPTLDLVWQAHQQWIQKLLCLLSLPACFSTRSGDVWWIRNLTQMMNTDGKNRSELKYWWLFTENSTLNHLWWWSCTKWRQFCDQEVPPDVHRWEYRPYEQFLIIHTLGMLNFRAN